MKKETPCFVVAYVRDTGFTSYLAWHGRVAKGFTSEKDKAARLSYMDAKGYADIPPRGMVGRVVEVEV